LTLDEAYEVRSSPGGLGRGKAIRGCRKKKKLVPLLTIDRARLGGKPVQLALILGKN